MGWAVPPPFLRCLILLTPLTLYAPLVNLADFFLTGCMTPFDAFFGTTHVGNPRPPPHLPPPTSQRPLDGLFSKGRFWSPLLFFSIPMGLRQTPPPFNLAFPNFWLSRSWLVKQTSPFFRPPPGKLHPPPCFRVSFSSPLVSPFVSFLPWFSLRPAWLMFPFVSVGYHFPPSVRPPPLRISKTSPQNPPLCTAPFPLLLPFLVEGPFVEVFFFQGLLDALGPLGFGTPLFPLIHVPFPRNTPPDCRLSPERPVLIASILFCC